MLRVLLAFGPERPTARVDELAGAAQVPLSSAYRYVGLLRSMGLVSETGDGAYQLTPLVMGLAQAARLANGLHTQLRPVLEALRASSGESALFLRRAGDHVVCTDLAESLHPVRLSFTPGHPMPLHAGAGAKLLLASLPREQQQAYIERHQAQMARPLRQKLLRELEPLRRQGWSISEAEVDDGVWAAAALVIDAAAVVGVLTVAGPAFRISKTQRKRVLSGVRQAAADISRKLIDPGASA